MRYIERVFSTIRFINLGLLPIIIPITLKTIDQTGYEFFIVAIFILFCTSFTIHDCKEDGGFKMDAFVTFHWINIITTRAWILGVSMTCVHKFNSTCKYFIETLVDMRTAWMCKEWKKKAKNASILINKFKSDLKRFQCCKRKRAARPNAYNDGLMEERRSVHLKQQQCRQTDNFALLVYRVIVHAFVFVCLSNFFLHIFCAPAKNWIWVSFVYNRRLFFGKLLDKDKSNFFLPWFVVRLLFIDANLHIQINDDVRKKMNHQRGKVCAWRCCNYYIGSFAVLNLVRDNHTLEQDFDIVFAVFPCEKMSNKMINNNINKRLKEERKPPQILFSMDV